MNARLICILFLLIFCFPCCTKSQSFAAFSTGFSKDLNNQGKPFYHIPFSLLIEPFKISGFFIEANYGIPISRINNADAYTQSVSLPEHVTLSESIVPHLFTIFIGGEIHLYTNKKNNSFCLNAAIGVSSQNIKVNYRNYDKVHYEVLNPDISTDSSGLVLAISGIYNFHKRRQDMFLMLKVQTAPAVSANGNAYYSLNYRLIAPLQLTFGYKLFKTKRK